MPGKIFYRERTKISEGSRTPRFRIVGVGGCDLKIYAEHLRRKELEQLAAEVGAELIELQRDPESSKQR